MEFSVCTVRDIEEPLPDPLEEGLLFPIPTAERNTVVLEPCDGDRHLQLVVGEFAVHDLRHQRQVAHMEDVRADVTVTDARVIIACSKFAKGGGWVGLGVGGLAFAAVANGVSRVRAARKRKGRMLVGHVRYPWIVSVAAKQGGFMKGKSELRLRLHASGGDETSSLVLKVPRDTDVTSVAVNVARRAARYRLSAEPELSPEDRTSLEALVEAAGSSVAPGEIATYAFPSPQPVSIESALLAPSPVEAS